MDEYTQERILLTDARMWPLRTVVVLQPAVTQNGRPAMSEILACGHNGELRPVSGRGPSRRRCYHCALERQP